MTMVHPSAAARVPPMAIDPESDLEPDLEDRDSDCDRDGDTDPDPDPDPDETSLSKARNEDLIGMKDG